jgi:hypothetical protein
LVWLGSLAYAQPLVKGELGYFLILPKFEQTTCLPTVRQKSLEIFFSSSL